MERREKSNKLKTMEARCNSQVKELEMTVGDIIKELREFPLGAVVDVDCSDCGLLRIVDIKESGDGDVTINTE